MAEEKELILWGTTSPGEVLEEKLQEMGVDINDFAVRIGYTPKTMNELLKAKCRVTVEMAYSLELGTGIPQYCWLNLQKQYDEDGYEIERAEDNDFPEYDDIPPVSSLYASPKFPKSSLSDPRRVPGFVKPPQPAPQPGPKNEDGVAIGGRVKHGVFGEGKIVQIVGSGESAKITVLFGNGTRRTFMLKFAPLEIL